MDLLNQEPGMAPPPPAGANTLPPKMRLTERERDQQEKLTWTWIFRTAVVQTTSHGFPFFFTGSFGSRIVWMIIVVAGTFLFVAQSTMLLIDVFNYPTLISTSQVARASVPFPRVTLCNVNKARNTHLRRLPANSPARRLVELEILSNVDHSDYPRHDLQFHRERTDDEACNNSRSLVTVTQPMAADASNATSPLDSGYATSANHFQCTTSATCVDQALLCDQSNDCDDKSDERFCGGGCDSSREFTCGDGTCIQAFRRCDQVFDCDDGSDELPQFCDESERNASLFYCCTSLYVVPIERTRDGIVDCMGDASDENLQGSQSSASDPWLVCDKEGGSGRVWVTRAMLNDGVEQCKGGLDEACGWKERQWQSPYSTPKYADYEERLASSDWPAGSKLSRSLGLVEAAVINETGHTFADMVISCLFAGDHCDTQGVLQFERSLHRQYGNCFSVQHNSMIEDTASKALRMIVNMEAYDYAVLYTSESGLVMFLTPPDTYNTDGSMFVDETSLVQLRPGSHHKVEVAKVTDKRLSSPYSDCVDYGAGGEFLKPFQCRRSFENKAKLALCGCTDDPAYQLRHDAQFCHPDTDGIFDCLDEARRRVDANCPDSCLNERYAVTHRSNEWPTMNALMPMMSTLSGGVQDGTPGRVVVQSMINFHADGLEAEAITIARSNFAKLTVSLAGKEETVHEQRPVHDAVAVMSNLGGLLGLYLGCSFMTMFEFIPLILHIVFVMDKRSRLRQFMRHCDEHQQRLTLVDKSPDDMPPDSGAGGFSDIPQFTDPRYHHLNNMMY